MSKETKLAKKELKAQKKAEKLEKKQAAAYAKLVKDIEKKNAKLEKKANKKNKPFVPIAIPTQEEAFANQKSNKAGNIVKLIVLLLLICYIIYFLIMWFQYVAPTKKAELPEEDTPSAAAEYDRYVNEHEITTTPDYPVSDAKALLKQVLKDNYSTMGYSSDPSESAINYTGSIKTVNNEDCYEFSASGKTFEVAINLSAVYLNDGGNFVPYTFHGTENLEFSK